MHVRARRHAPNPARTRRRRFASCVVAALGALSALTATVACDPEPHAAVYVLGDSNLPVNDLVLATRLRDRPYLVVPDPFPGFGVVNDPMHGIGSDFIERRLAAAVSQISPDVVVIELGINDHDVTWLDGYGSAIDRLMSKIPSTTKVIWTNVLPVPGRVEAAMRVNEELLEAEGRWPNLWVVEIDRIINEVLEGRCPVLAQGAISLQPLQACFVAFDAGNPHLAPPGSALWVVTVRLVLDEYLARGERGDEVALARQLLDTFGVTTTTTDPGSGI